MTYLSGYLHRDVSIGNVLMTEQPVKRKAFKVPEEFLAHLSSLKNESLVAKIRTLCDRVDQLVAELGICDECIGFITDGDLAISWEDCFSKENQETKSVSHSQVFSETVVDEACRVHPNSRRGHSRWQHEWGNITYIHLWMTWNPAFWSPFGAYSSTKDTRSNCQPKSI